MYKPAKTYREEKKVILFIALLGLAFLLLPNVSFAGYLEKTLWVVVNVLFGWMVWIGGSILNYGINEMVIGFGDMYVNRGIGSAIDSLWVVVRDIFNLTFIFGLVLIGLKMIFNSDDSGTRKMLISLIMAALLVNFSLFITKSVVDFSNIAAYQLVQAFPDRNVSGGFATLMGITSVFSTGSGKPLPSDGDGQLGYVFGSMLVFIVAAFVFISGGLLLMIRFAVLNIYLALSPLMFLGWVFPAAADLSKKYWSGFLGRAFFAPAYILMLYFSFQILSRFAVTGGNKEMGSGFSGGTVSDFGSTFPPFIITSIFLIASLVVAQKMGADGASGAMSMGKSLVGKGKKMLISGASRSAGATAGAGAYAGRRTLGAGANRLSNSKGLQDWAAKSKIGSAALQTTRKVADSSFDARAGLGLSKNFGTASKGGYKSNLDAKKKADEKFVESFDETKTRDEYDNLLPEMVERVNTGAAALANIDGHPLKVANDGLTKAEADEVRLKAHKKQKEEELVELNKPVNEILAATEEPYKAKIEALKRQRTLVDSVPEEARRLDAEIAAETQAMTKAREDRAKTLSDSKNQSQSDLDKINKDLEKAKTNLVKSKTKQKKALDDAAAEAEASITYEKQLAFIERREKEASAWENPLRKLGLSGASAGTGAVLLGGAAMAGGAVVGAGIASSYAQEKRASVENLKKKYGKNARNMKKKKSNAKNAELLAEFIKDNGASSPVPAATASDT